MAKYRLLSVTGSVPVVVTEDPPVTSSGDVNIVRSKERKLYNRLLLGTAKMSEVGESGPAGTDPTTLTATTPSWTQVQAGINHAFSLAPLSSSQHEVTRLNCFNSGTMALENTAVPASASMYYSKQNRFKRITYAVTSSANLVIVNSGSGTPSTTDIPTARSVFVSVSGNYISADPSQPAEIPIFISEYGKIVDIKVWVEFLTDVRSVQRGAVTTLAKSGIWTVALSLQSPNSLQNQFGRPLFNIPQVRNFAVSDRAQQRASWVVSALDAGCYPLWLGGSDGPPVDSTFSSSWISYGTDLDIRTIFTDGSTTRNPYDGTGLPYDPSVGMINYWTASGSLPSSKLKSKYGPINSLTGSVSGSWVPWFVDPRIQGGYLQSVSSSLYTTLGAGSPPKGWITGPGGAANVNEFPTTGSQLGPETIKPVWPLLDDVYSTDSYDTTPDDQPSYYVSTQKILGYRPGLRGTQVNGLWKLLVGTGQSGCWFRQFRLEIVIDTGQERSFGTPSKSKLYKRTGRPILNRDFLFSANVLGQTEPAAASYGIALRGVETCFTIPPPQYGRSVGITAFTGSGDDFSVFTRITGSLARTIGENPSFFLGNEFGTPFIPISSASLSSFNLFSTDNANDAADRQSILDVILSKTDIPTDNSLRATLSRTKYFMDLRTKAFETLIPKFIPEASGGTYSNSTRPSAISVPIGTKIYNTDTKQIQSSDGYNWKDSDGNIV